MTDEQWNWLWGKTGPDGSFLPLRMHLEDVAAVALRLWEVALTARQRAWLAAGFGIDEAEARTWIGFLAAFHDLGKANPSFQTQVQELAGRLLPSDLATSRGQFRFLRHDTVSGAILIDWLMKYGASKNGAEELAATVSGHHSIPKTAWEVRHAGRKMPSKWRGVQQDLADSLASQFGVDSLPVPDGLSAPIVLATAGLICVADWIASDKGRFPVTDGPRPASSELARGAVAARAWAPRQLPGTVPFEGAFGFAPRASQRAVCDALAGEDGGPFLLLLEDRPGSGKTEAALMAVQECLAAGFRGLYIGMPTQATANQLHRRTRDFLATLWPGDGVAPRLLHGGVNLDGDLPAPTGVGGDPGRSDPEAQAGMDAEAQAWFAQSRRGLLSPYGVGTVDQALLATISARHYPARILGLQGKVVVMDEVHAYDAYTGFLLESLIRWLAALDCTVILLSATLPTSRRRKLVASYLEGGAGEGRVEADAISSQAYPRITLASARGGLAQVAVADDRPGREVDLSWEPLAASPADGESGAEERAIADKALEEIEAGGCLAVVCSTVAQAQRLYAELRERAPAESGPVSLELLHSRMRRMERTPIERRLLSMLGPEDSDPAAPHPRPDRLIVVATQVIEQSLDIDFDVMISHLAPIDLLIQRAGRVHRHARPRRPRHRRPRLIVLDSRGSSPLRPVPAGSAAVYVEAALVRTRLALLGHASLREPDDLDRLIATVYEADVNPGRDAEERDHVERLDGLARQEHLKKTSWANYLALKPPLDPVPPWEAGLDPLEAPEHPSSTVMNSAATRYSEHPSLSVIPVFPDELPGNRRTPSADDVSELLQLTVPISSPHITRPLLATLSSSEPGPVSRGGSPFVPPAWLRNGRLRYQFLIELDAAGVPLPVDGRTGESIVLPFRLDKDLGVVEERGADEVRSDR